MEDDKIIEKWGSFYNSMCKDIRTKNGLLFLVAHWCLLNIVDMECAENVYTSESHDKRKSLPQVWDHDDARLALRYKSGNQVYTLLGEVTNASYYLLNFKNRQIKALSRNLILNVDDMTIVIYGKITLRKSVQEVTKILLDELFTPVLHLSRAVSYLHTNSNGQFYIPPSLENADLQYLHQYLFRHRTDSTRYLGQLRRAPDGNSGVISHTPGGYSGMYLNPHSSSNSQYFGGLGIIPGIWPSPEGYNGMLVNPTHLANSQYFGGFERIPGSSPTPGGSNGMLANPTHLANSHYFGGSERIPRSWPSPGGYNGMLVNPTHSANSQYSGGFERIPGSSPTPGGYHGMLVNPAHLANSQYFGGLERIPGNSPTPGGYNGMSVNPTHLANSQYLGRFERIPESSPTPTLGWGETISYRPFLTNPKPLGGAAETLGRIY
ncbi:Proteasome inhibitor PI31 subunit [Pseudolycoriella hygida]|uniref:Proteasome inhibitor PI31 subunit n=1 Tax=Pseudolycoriella hygida TaxID=35572 RepID=A0A9Q0NCB6_9DIPT|nr:Proteasome inhibitor PI31 subunit [Pseudolycoriella hygida]